MTDLTEIYRLYGAHRMKMYLAARDGDTERALKLYVQNVKQSADYWKLIETVEVLLRNRISGYLFPEGRVQYFEGCTWQSWTRPDMNRDSFFIDEFSFGFWPFLINSANANRTWNAGLHRSFRSKTSRSSLHEATKQIHALRNKIGHHDPVWHLDHNTLTASFEFVLMAISESAYLWARDQIGFPVKL